MPIIRKHSSATEGVTTVAGRRHIRQPAKQDLYPRFQRCDVGHTDDRCTARLQYARHFAGERCAQRQMLDDFRAADEITGVIGEGQGNVRHVNASLHIGCAVLVDSGPTGDIEVIPETGVVRSDFNNSGIWPYQPTQDSRGCTKSWLSNDLMHGYIHSIIAQMAMPSTAHVAGVINDPKTVLANIRISQPEVRQNTRFRTR